jgi:pimeloyl-ACP methyl ester carboxylesterase
VQGTDDRYGTVAHVEAVRDDVAARDVELLVLDGGHSPHLEHRERVRDAIAAHLEA